MSGKGLPRKCLPLLSLDHFEQQNEIKETFISKNNPALFLIGGHKEKAMYDDSK